MHIAFKEWSVICRALKPSGKTIRRVGEGGAALAAGASSPTHARASTRRPFISFTHYGYHWGVNRRRLLQTAAG